MRAYHNDPAIKAYYLARVQAHRQREHGAAFAVGSILNSSAYEAYEIELGIPRLLARLEDGIFESLASPHDIAWPADFLTAIPVGADLTMVWPHFALLLLADPTHGVLQYVHDARLARQRASIQTTIDYYSQWVRGGIKPADVTAYVDSDTAAYADIETATDYAAVAYADATAYAAATTATDDAYAAADYAATTAAAAAYTTAAYTTAAHATAAHATAAGKAARYTARLWQGETLLRLLRDAPIGAEGGG